VGKRRRKKLLEGRPIQRKNQNTKGKKEKGEYKECSLTRKRKIWTVYTEYRGGPRQ